MTFAFRTPKPNNTGRQSGSFYDAIPSNLFQVIHKPSNDEILKQIKASTKYDKNAEWRGRSRYNGGYNKEIDDLQKQGILFGRHSSRSEYPSIDFSSSERRKVMFHLAPKIVIEAMNQRIQIIFIFF